MCILEFVTLTRSTGAGAGRECCYVNRFTRDTCAWCLAPRAGATLPLGARQAIRAALSAADRKSTSTVQASDGQE